MSRLAYGILVLALAFAPIAELWAEPSYQGLIRVHYAGMRNSAGTVYCSLFDQPKGFPGASGARQTARGRTSGDTAVCEFSAVPAGRYAVNVFHDENDNGRMDRKWFFIPAEGWGTSRDAPGHFGPPQFKDALFEFDGGELELPVREQ